MRRQSYKVGGETDAIGERVERSTRKRDEALNNDEAVMKHEAEEAVKEAAAKNEARGSEANVSRVKGKACGSDGGSTKLKVEHMPATMLQQLLQRFS